MGGLAGLFGGMASSAGQFGLNYASALLSADIQRDLRRTAYQDQMHSMKKAGLNPILAYGGGAGAGQGSVSMAAPEDPVSAANQLASGSSSRRLQRAQESTAMATAEKAEADAQAAKVLLAARKLELEERAGLHRSSRLLNDERTKSESVLRPGREMKLWEDAGLAGARAATEDALRAARGRALREQAARDAASAGEILRRQPEHVLGEEGGMVFRGAKMATDLGGEVLDLVPGASKVLESLRGVANRWTRKRRVKKRLAERETNTSAKSVDREYRYWKDEPREEYNPNQLEEGYRYWETD